MVFTYLGKTNIVFQGFFRWSLVRVSVCLWWPQRSVRVMRAVHARQCGCVRACVCCVPCARRGRVLKMRRREGGPAGGDTGGSTPALGCARGGVRGTAHRDGVGMPVCGHLQAHIWTIGSADMIPPGENADFGDPELIYFWRHFWEARQGLCREKALGGIFGRPGRA